MRSTFHCTRTHNLMKSNECKQIIFIHLLLLLLLFVGSSEWMLFNQKRWSISAGDLFGKAASDIPYWSSNLFFEFRLCFESFSVQLFFLDSDFSVVNICWFVHCLLSYGHRELWLSLICLLFSHLTVFFLVSLFSPRRNAYHTLLCAVFGVIVTQFRAARSRYYQCPTTLVKYQVKFDQGSFIRIFKTSIFFIISHSVFIMSEN